MGSAAPTTYVRDSQRRLAFTMKIVAVLFVVYNALYRTVWSEFRTDIGQGHAALGFLISVATVWYLRKPRNQREVSTVGGVCIVLHCVGLSVVQYTSMLATDIPSSQISWVCVMIMLIPFLVPARPRNIAWIGLFAALTDPAGWVIARQLGNLQDQKIGIAVSYWLPAFVCWLMAWGLAGVVYQLGRAAERARQLGAYVLTEKLGAGGMGEVWRASHRLLARPAAVKLIQADLESSLTAARFEREAQATAALESPHTVQLYDFGVADDGTLFYVMELLRGVDLETLVADHGPLPPERVAHLLLQACESLGEAHRAGLVHRDVKPANLFVCRKGARVDFLKVLDFGLVKSSQSEESSLETKDGQITGTPAYLPPEAIRGEPPIGPYSDLYALGCVAYFLLVGRPIFGAKNLLETAAGHLHEEPPRPSDEVECPEALEALILELLAKKIDERPASAEEVASRIEAMGLEWSREAATDWWKEHLPELVASGGSTRQQSTQKTA